MSPRGSLTIPGMDLDAFRRQMPVTRSWVYFDHAAVSPLPEPARAALAEWADDVAANGLVHIGRAGSAASRRSAGSSAGCSSADPLDVAFVKNTSEGIGIVAEGLPWQPGDNVVTVDQEYPANVYPWMNLASRGVELRRVRSRPGGVVSLDDLAAAIDARTGVVTLSFVEFATGFRNDLDAVGRLCRDRGALFFVDAIQGLGVLPIDVTRTPIDFLAADGHKWLLGPEGAGRLLDAPRAGRPAAARRRRLEQRRRRVRLLDHRLPPQAARRPLRERHPQRRRHPRPGREPRPAARRGRSPPIEARRSSR